MAEGQTHGSLTPDEIQAFAQKLEAWGESLTPKEQAFLIEILGRAASTEDVTGHAFDAFNKALGLDAFKKLGGEDAFVKLRVLPALTQIASFSTER